jgi:hypothetical protein
MLAMETPFDSDVVVSVLVGAIHVPKCGDQVMACNAAPRVCGSGERHRNRWCMRAGAVLGRTNVEDGRGGQWVTPKGLSGGQAVKLELSSSPS